MDHFANAEMQIAFIDEGIGEPVLLIHGFASSSRVNWLEPGWIKTLTDAGYRAIALDNRGHGRSTKSHDPADYEPALMADDAVALLDHLGIARAHVMGYSMGARITAFLLLNHPERARSAVFGGLGMGLVEGVGDWDPIAAALLAKDPSTITDAKGKMFRAFADRTKSDRQALAACIRASRQELSPGQIAHISQPVLVAVGTKDKIGGDPHRLAALLPKGRALDIPGRDHMLAVGDKIFKTAVLEFLRENPLDAY